MDCLIHPFSSAYPRPGHEGGSLSKSTQTSLSPAMFSHSWRSPWCPQPEKICCICIPQPNSGSACVSSLLDVPLEGGVQEDSSSQAQITSADSSQSKKQQLHPMSIFLTLFLRLSPEPLQRTIISVSCIHDFIPSV